MQSNILKWSFRVLAAVMILWGLYLFSERLSFASSALNATGTIIGYVDHRSDDGSVYYPKIRFQTQDGRVIVFESGSGSNPPVPKDRPMEVLYNPANPQEARVGTIMSLYGGPILCMVFGLFVVVFLWGMERMGDGERDEALDQGQAPTYLSLPGALVYRPRIQWVFAVIGTCFLLISAPILLSVYEDHFGYPGAQPDGQAYLVLGLVGLFFAAGLGLLTVFFRGYWRHRNQPPAYCRVESKEDSIGGVFRAKVETGPVPGPIEARLTNYHAETGRDADNHAQTFFKVYWSGTQTFERPSGNTPAGGGFFDIRVEVPKGTYPTGVAGKGRNAWRLELNSTGHPGKFHCEFEIILKGEAPSAQEALPAQAWEVKRGTGGTPEGMTESREGAERVWRQEKPLEPLGVLFTAAWFLGFLYLFFVFGVEPFSFFFMTFFGVFAFVGAVGVDIRLGRVWEIRLGPSVLRVKAGRRRARQWDRTDLESLGLSWKGDRTGSDGLARSAIPMVRTRDGVNEELGPSHPDRARADWIISRLQEALKLPVQVALPEGKISAHGKKMRMVLIGFVLFSMIGTILAPVMERARFQREQEEKLKSKPRAANEPQKPFDPLGGNRYVGQPSPTPMPPRSAPPPPKPVITPALEKVCVQSGDGGDKFEKIADPQPAGASCGGKWVWGNDQYMPVTLVGKEIPFIHDFDVPGDVVSATIQFSANGRAALSFGGRGLSYCPDEPGKDCAAVYPDCRTQDVTWLVHPGLNGFMIVAQDLKGVRLAVAYQLCVTYLKR